MSGHRTYILTNLKIQNYVSKIKLFSPYMDVQSSLEHVAVHFYLVLTAILGYLDSFMEKFYPDIVSLSGRRRWSQLHVLSRGQGISLKLKFIIYTDNDWSQSLLFYLLRLRIV